MNLIIEQKYAELNNKLMLYIEEIKENDSKAELTAIILDFALQHELSVELVGDAIRNDHYLKSFIERDLRINDPKNQQKDW